MEGIIISTPRRAFIEFKNTVLVSWYANNNRTVTKMEIYGYAIERRTSNFSMTISFISPATSRNIKPSPSKSGGVSIGGVSGLNRKGENLF